MGKPRKPTIAKLRKAADEMDRARGALEQAQYDFALQIYEAGYHDLKSFCDAIRRALSEYGGRIKISEKETMFLFGRVARKNTSVERPISASPKEEGEKMKGVVFDSDEPLCDLSETILTKNKFSCRYSQLGYTYSVEATSHDGITYRGNWGTPNLDEDYTVELKRFESKTKEIVLLGTWKNLADIYEGVYLFRLNQ
jgi:hypothetical protein